MLDFARPPPLARRRVTFAFETTLSGRAHARWIAGLLETGYRFNVIFLWLPSADFAVARVADRVRMGGHSVPPDTVCRRYAAGLRNFFALYRPLASKWRMYDNSGQDEPRFIASGRGERVESRDIGTAACALPVALPSALWYDS